MKIKSIGELKGGEILAEPLLSEKRDTIIPRGTLIKSEYIPLIISMGVSTVMIEDPYESYETPNSIIDSTHIEKYVQYVKKIMEGHIYQSNQSLRQCEVIANELVKEIQEISDDVVIDMKERTNDLYEHTIMVTLLSLVVAKKMHFERERLYQIALGCLLHDIGLRYITVPYENENMKEMASANAFELKKHTILGFCALEGEHWIPSISRKMILSHHERYDGTGYPMRQKYKEPECKIIQVCDTFDRYLCGIECKRISIQDIFVKLEKQANVRYDKKVVDLLLDTIASYPVGTKVKLTGEREAVVISQTTDKNYPIVMLTDVVDNSEKKYEKHNLLLEKNVSILQVM